MHSRSLGESLERGRTGHSPVASGLARTQSGGTMSERTEPGRGIGTSGVTGSDAPGLRFQMLGALRATLNGSAANLGGPQQRAVLALLLLDGASPVPVARIADALWGERPPPGSSTTIQTYVFHLREALEPDRPRGTPARVLVSERGGYRLE